MTQLIGAISLKKIRDRFSPLLSSNLNTCFNSHACQNLHFKCILSENRFYHIFSENIVKEYLHTHIFGIFQVEKMLFRSHNDKVNLAATVMSIYLWIIIYLFFQLHKADILPHSILYQSTLSLLTKGQDRCICIIGKGDKEKKC